MRESYHFPGNAQVTESSRLSRSRGARGGEGNRSFQFVHSLREIDGAFPGGTTAPTVHLCERAQPSAAALDSVGTNLPIEFQSKLDLAGVVGIVAG
jgi:hypothetical protein